MSEAMDRLHFAAQFFHFTASQWPRISGERLSERAWIRWLFGQCAQRTLRVGPLAGADAALSLYDKLLQEEASLGIRSVRPVDFPEQLRQYLPPERLPPLLFLRGPAPPPEGDLVAVVGTRAPSAFGARAARDFSAFLTSAGIRVVSGLARGIDAIAHAEGLETGTVAVLGGGVGEVYPSEHQHLAERILTSGGTLISQFPLWQVPLPQNFPQRNELIAALAIGSIVIEGSEKSGAAITGKLALEMDKAVVTLTQDFRSAFGRGAIRLQQCGATLAATEEEALHALYARRGGFPWPLADKQPPGRAKSFDFAAFHTLAEKSVPEAVALLEEGIRNGRIERLDTDRYRFIGRNSRD